MIVKGMHARARTQFSDHARDAPKSGFLQRVQGNLLAI